MNINIRTIPHKEQRYPTAGDYWEHESPENGSVVEFRISVLPRPEYEQLVLIHELVEYFLVKLSNIPLKDIDDFDILFEKIRPLRSTAEPGDDRAAPYYHQHQMASLVERLFAGILDVDWQDYEDAINKL